METINNYSTDLSDYIIYLKEIENNHKLKKQAKTKQLEKIAEYVIYSLSVLVIFLISAQVLGV